MCVYYGKAAASAVPNTAPGSRHKNEENTSVPESNVAHLTSRADTICTERIHVEICTMYVGVLVSRACIMESSLVDLLSDYSLPIWTSLPLPQDIVLQYSINLRLYEVHGQH